MDPDPTPGNDSTCSSDFDRSGRQRAKPGGAAEWRRDYAAWWAWRPESRLSVRGAVGSCSRRFALRSRKRARTSLVRGVLLAESSRSRRTTSRVSGPCARLNRGRRNAVWLRRWPKLRQRIERRWFGVSHAHDVLLAFEQHLQCGASYYRKYPRVNLTSSMGQARCLGDVRSPRRCSQRCPSARGLPTSVATIRAREPRSPRAPHSARATPVANCR